MRFLDHHLRTGALLIVFAHFSHGSDFSSLSPQIRWSSYVLFPVFVFCWMVIIALKSHFVFRSVSNETAHPTQMYDWGDSEFEQAIMERNDKRSAE